MEEKNLEMVGNVILENKDALLANINAIKDDLKEVANADVQALKPHEAKEKLEGIQDKIVDAAKSNYKNIAAGVNKMSSMTLEKMYVIKEFYQLALKYIEKLDKGEDVSEELLALDKFKELDSAEAEGFDKLKFKVDEFKEFVDKKEITQETIQKDIDAMDNEIQFFKERRITSEQVLNFITTPEVMMKLNKVALENNPRLLKFYVDKYKKFLSKKGASPFVNKQNEYFDVPLFRMTVAVSNFFEDEDNIEVVNRWVIKSGIDLTDTSISPEDRINLVYKLKSNMALFLTIGVMEFVHSRCLEEPKHAVRSETIGFLYALDYNDIYKQIVKSFFNMA